MVPAVRGIQRAHPFADLVVLDLGELFEISADDGRGVRRCAIRAYFGHGRGEMYDGIILYWNGGVSRRAPRDHGNIHRHFFDHLYGYVLHFAILDDHVAAFVDRKACGEFVPVLGDQRLDAGLAAMLFVRRGEKNHVAVQMRVRSLQRNEHGKIRRQHSLVVHSAAAVDVAILLEASERVAKGSRPPRPNRRVMILAQKRPRGIGHGCASQARHHAAAPGRRLQKLGVYALLFQNSGHVLRSHPFVPRRVGRIDANQVDQPARRFPGKRGCVRAGDGRGGCARNVLLRHERCGCAKGKIGGTQ